MYVILSYGRRFMEASKYNLYMHVLIDNKGMCPEAEFSITFIPGINKSKARNTVGTRKSTLGSIYFGQK